MQHFGPGSKLNQQISRKIIEVYTGEDGLGELGLIEPQRDGFRRLTPRGMGPWTTPAALAKAYA